MGKQIIRLTEEDLHNIIKESVKKVITELDWKTYMNAAHKDSNRRRRNEFRKTAIDKFNDKYEYHDKRGNTVKLNGNNSLDGTTHLVGQTNQGVKGNPSMFLSPSSNTNDSDYSCIPFDGGKDDIIYNDKPFTQDIMYSKYLRNAYNEFENYRKGNYTYNKGQGWKKNKNKIDSNKFNDFLKYDE